MTDNNTATVAKNATVEKVALIGLLVAVLFDYLCIYCLTVARNYSNI